MGLHCPPQLWLGFFPMEGFKPTFPFSGSERTFKDAEPVWVQVKDRKRLLDALLGELS